MIPTNIFILGLSFDFPRFILRAPSITKRQFSSSNSRLPHFMLFKRELYKISFLSMLTALFVFVVVVVDDVVEGSFNTHIRLA